ncbi:MAG: hypothetical protein HGA67_04495 [Candidatus Yonathbacteria bacterium]|nr:hypothetical protein [Candidatus Yonathbacteria bacterium]
MDKLVAGAQNPSFVGHVLTNGIDKEGLEKLHAGIDEALSHNEAVLSLYIFCRQNNITMRIEDTATEAYIKDDVVHLPGEIKNIPMEVDAYREKLERLNEEMYTEKRKLKKRLLWLQSESCVNPLEQLRNIVAPVERK